MGFYRLYLVFFVCFFLRSGIGTGFYGFYLSIFESSIITANTSCHHQLSRSAFLVGNRSSKKWVYLLALIVFIFFFAEFALKYIFSSLPPSEKTSLSLYGIIFHLTYLNCYNNSNSTMLYINDHYMYEFKLEQLFV